VLEARPDGQRGNLRDRTLGRDVELGVVEHAAARRFDGRTVDEIATEIEATGLGAPAAVEQAVRALMLLNLVEGAGESIRARLARIRGEERLGHVVLEGARFGCQGSGECCQNYNLGPLTDADEARLASLDLAGAFPAIAPPYVIPIEGKGRFLRSDGDRCIFLEDDARCGLHARFGAASKPGLCRLYPLEELPTIDGIKLYDKGSCASFARSARSGLPIVDQLPQLRPLLPAEQPLYHPFVLLGSQLAFDYGHYLRLSRAQLELVRRGPGTPPERLRAAGRLLAELASALAACPLTAGEPDATIEAVLAQDRAHLHGPASTTATKAGAEVLARVAAELLGAAAGTISSALSSRALAHRLMRELVQLLHIVHESAVRVVDDAAPVSDYGREIAARPLADPDGAADVLVLSLRQQLFGFAALVGGRPRAALLRMAFVELCALAGARLRAVVEDRPSASTDDLSWGHMLATRVLDMDGAERVLVAHEADALTALEALPAVAGWETL
jgi:hypothetical protein